MYEKRLAFIVMLFAGAVVSLSCFIWHVELVPTIVLICASLLIFYILGLIICSIISKINREAEDRAVRLAKEKKALEEENEEDEDDDEDEDSEEAESQKSESEDSSKA